MIAVDQATRRERMEEAWLLNEFELGYLQLCRYLKKWAVFMDWCRENQREEMTSAREKGPAA